MDSRRIGMLACVVIVALAALAGVLYGLYRLVLKVPPGIVAAWALLATALLPLAAFGFYRLGQLEARGQIAGLQAGLLAAIGAGKEIADVKVSTARAMRQPEPVQQVNLPVIEVRPRQLPGGDGGKVYM